MDPLEEYDSLPAVRTTDLRGLWRGSGVPSGHPLDGVLERLGWFGKWFGDDDRVHPLVFRTWRGLRPVDPALVPLGLVLRSGPLLRTAPVAGALAAVAPLATTLRPRARLREVRYRGVVSTALVYDDLPVIDVFRTVDDRTVLGAMDARGMARPFLFQLTRAHAGDAATSRSTSTCSAPSSPARPTRPRRSRTSTSSRSSAWSAASCSRSDSLPVPGSGAGCEACASS